MTEAQKREAVARLLGTVEGVLICGALPMSMEMKLRTAANDACAAFDMMRVYERTIDAVSAEMSADKPAIWDDSAGQWVTT